MTNQPTNKTTSVRLLDAEAIAALKSDLRGEVMLPGDTSYNAARRIWNGLIDKHPAVIARCTSAADVIAAIRFAHNNELIVAVRGGGHSTAGLALCDDGLVIDLSPMKGIRVDPVRRTVRAEPGLRLGELLRETQVFGLATTTGVVSETGLAGLALGGGMGYLMGKYGLTIDNLLSADVVIADGRLLLASADEHADLFWAVRGGGGNFGVVTSFELQLHPAAQVLAGMLLHPFTRAAEGLRFYRDFTRDCPDELTVYAALITAPDGQPALALIACYAGDFQRGERALAPLRAFGPPLTDMIRPMSLPKLNSLFDDAAPAGELYTEKASALPSLPDSVIDALVASAEARPSPGSHLVIQHLHGAAARVDPAATAFALRREQYMVGMIGCWSQGPAEPYVTWAHDLCNALKPFALDGVYVNTLQPDDGHAQVQASYGANYERLVRVKNVYDPTNFFRINHNIAPSIGQ
jgi:FAD/FMN-containing dehydrogenase